MPYIESIIWSTKPLNLAILSEFNSAMGDYFGQKIYDDVKKSEKVDKELKECFKDLLPKPEDINTYFIQFSNRTGMTL